MGSQPGTAILICARAIEALAFGIKGVAAHADHAWVLGQKDDAAFALIHNTLADTVNPSITLDGLMDLILECGRINLRAMEIPNQGHTESPLFPGAILMTTNCIQEPSASYLGNIFTTGLVAWPGVTHIARDDFTALLERAQDLPGFGEHPGKRIQVGFGHNAMLSVSDRLIEAVKQGVIRHFFLIAGCDGAKPGRKYYTEFARNPQGRHHPDARLRQIPLQYPGTRHRGRPAPRVGHRAVQRCLPGCSNRGGSGQVL